MLKVFMASPEQLELLGQQVHQVGQPIMSTPTTTTTTTTTTVKDLVVSV